jgi:hypothetical protein
MELYVLAVGQTDSLKRWEADINAQFLPMWKNGKPYIKDGQKMYRRLLVAPIVPYKIAFDKENLDKVLSFVGSDDYVLKNYSLIGKFVKFFRRLLKLKDVPKAKTLNPFLQPNQVDKAVGIWPIGIKEDRFVNGFELI